MTLGGIAAGGDPVPLALVGADKTLTREVQDRLAVFGLLDPPSDGSFGPVSLWALDQFLRRISSGRKTAVDGDVARALSGGDPSAFFPVNEVASLAGRIVKAMQAAGYWISRHPDCTNIVYVEGLDPDGTPNLDVPNEFNDLRLLLRVNRAGNPEIVESWEATTEPGKYYTLIEKLDPLGAARIAFGQFKSWSVGIHNFGRPTAHEALVQTAPIRVYRDLNEDFEREGDNVFEGMFGVNQHWGFDQPRSDIGRASAGCLVGRTKAGHRTFMATCKSDPRYTANHSYRFVTTVLPARALSAA